MRCFTAALAVGGLACSAGSPPRDDAGPPDAGPVDAFVPPTDSGFDAGPDDTGVDAPAEPDTGTDAGEPDAGRDCPVCTPPDECVLSICVDFACVETVVPDGTTCGEMLASVCVAGRCRARACGDGFVESGTGMLAREACDDGNTLDGDACSSSCTPSFFPIAATREVEETFAGPYSGAAVDGTGAVLFVWLTTPVAGIDTLHARRFDRHGNALDSAPQVLADTLFNGRGSVPNVAGLRGGGWVVTWSPPTSSSDAVPFRLVDADGTAGPVLDASATMAGDKKDSRVAALGDGFVIAWTHTEPTVPRDPDAGASLRARRFDATGAPLGPEITVPAARDREEAAAALATGEGEQWIAVWHAAEMAVGAVPSIRARRMMGDSPLDAADLEIASGIVVQRPSVATLEDGDYVVVWPFNDDVFARTVPRSGDILGAVVPVSTRASYVERNPSVAPLGSSEYVVVWAERGDRRGGAFGASDPALLPPEAAILASALGTDTNTPGDLFVSPAPDGTWFGWSALTPGGPDGDSRTIYAFLLPRGPL